MVHIPRKMLTHILVLNVQAGKFFLIGAILHHIGAGILVTRICGGRHALALLAMIADLKPVLTMHERQGSPVLAAIIFLA